MIKFVRTHDSLYLSENRYQDPKQLHLEIIEKIRKFEKTEARQVATILDAGCAAGEFAFALRENFPDAKISGFDLLPDLVKKARLEVKRCNFFEADIQDENKSLINSFDVVVCTGVLSIFDTFEPVLNNLISWVKPEGALFIHSLFNDYPIDVLIKYNLSEDYTSGLRENGWNIFSKNTVSRFLQELILDKQVESFDFHNFELKRELLERDDKVRSWTERKIDGRLQITNGLMILQPHAILEIKKAL